MKRSGYCIVRDLFSLSADQSKPQFLKGSYPIFHRRPDNTLCAVLPGSVYPALVQFRC